MVITSTGGDLQFSAMADKWKYFERLVAAIHKAADEGAEVHWGETINGRQFDVTIRFRRGLYEYLTVVECKCYEKPVSVDKVEAFVTKSSDAQADLAVMASRSGFQEGAQKVAQRHNVTLIHVTDSSEIDPHMFGAKWGPDTAMLHVERIELEYCDGEKVSLPTAANVMTYYARQLIIQCGMERMTLDQMIDRHRHILQATSEGSYHDQVITCPADTHVLGPDDGEVPLRALARVHVRAAIVQGKTLTGPVKFDPSFFMPDVKVRNISTGEEQAFKPLNLALGIDTIFAEGNFYEQPQSGMYYYCASIRDGLATIHLVESFQHGQLFQATFTMETKHANLFVPVSDSAVVQRLQRRLALMRSEQTKN